MPKWLVAVNPAAGRRPVELDEVRGALRAATVDFELAAPSSADEMRSILTEAANRGQTHFAVVGGDGTVNLAVNSLLPLGMDRAPVIGVLPAGTGCDLMRTFGLPQDMAAAARHLATDETYPADVAFLEGTWGRRYFVNVGQAGVGAAAVQTAPRLSRRMGSARYPLAFIARLPRFPPARIRLTTERRTLESNALAVIMANAQFFAGGWNVAPKATLVDGVLDIQVIDIPKRQAPAMVPKIIKGNHLREAGVRRLAAGEFDLVTEPAWPVEVDGDLIGNTPLSGRVLPAAIHLKI